MTIAVQTLMMDKFTLTMNLQ